MINPTLPEARPNAMLTLFAVVFFDGSDLLPTRIWAKDAQSAPEGSLFDCYEAILVVPTLPVEMPPSQWPPGTMAHTLMPLSMAVSVAEEIVVSPDMDDCELFRSMTIPVAANPVRRPMADCPSDALWSD